MHTKLCVSVWEKEIGIEDTEYIRQYLVSYLVFMPVDKTLYST